MGPPRRRGGLTSCVDDPVAQRSYTLDLRLDDIARLEKLRRGAREADAVWRSGRDHRAREQSHPLGDPFDHRIDRVDHVARVAVLLGLAVDAEQEPQRLRIGNLVPRHDPGTDWAETVKALALEVLAAPPELDVARADVVHRDKAKDVVKSAHTRNVDAAPADDKAQLDLPVDLTRHRGVDTDIVMRAGDAGDGFGEHGGRIDNPADSPCALLRMRLVVAPDGDHVAAGLWQRRQQLNAVDTVPLGLCRGQCRSCGGQTPVAGVDQRQHVTRLGKLDHLAIRHGSDSGSAVAAEGDELHLTAPAEGEDVDAVAARLRRWPMSRAHSRMSSSISCWISTCSLLAPHRVPKKRPSAVNTG